jgi:hypothetical protein
MFVGVAACTSLFRQFFKLVRSGKGKDHLGAYYFQSRTDPIVTYIASLGGARWENWRSDWVIESRLEGGVNRANLKFTNLITTTSRVSVRNIIESKREGAKQIASE